MNNARSEIKIDRAHRIGNYDRGSCRPIVAKFNYFQDKMKIKQQMLDNPRASNKRVSDQFPRAIQERRKILIPYLVKARSDGKRASLVHDKLHIDDATFTVDKLPQALHPNCRHDAPIPSIKMQAGKPITVRRADHKSRARISNGSRLNFLFGMFKVYAQNCVTLTFHAI